MASTKSRKLRDRLQEIEDELRRLEDFRTTKPLQQFKRQLLGELSYVNRQIQLQKPQKLTARDKRRIQTEANRNRSEKMKRAWRYFEALQENYYPYKSLKEIRSSFKKHREGLGSDISEIAWRNPSP